MMRRGQATVTVLVLVSVLAVLTFAMQSVMLGFHTQAHRLGVDEDLAAAARSGVSIAAVKLRTMAGEVAFRTSLSDPAERPALAVDLEPEAGLLVAEMPDLALEASVKIGAALTLAGKPAGDAAEVARQTAGRGRDAAEQRRPVTITCTARAGAAERTVSEVRELAVVDVAPGIAGKFTLWARNISGNVNTLKVDARGARQGGPAPLVCENGAAVEAREPALEPWRDRGYVYLGGEPVLNVAAGRTGDGDLWTFYPQGASGDGAPVYSDGDPPDFFGRTYPAPTGAPAGTSPYQFMVQHEIPGYYTGTDAQGRSLDAVFPREKDAGGSVLKPFGSAEQPSPTLVLGSVRRGYPLVGGVTVDATADGEADALVTILPEEGAPRPAIPARVPAFARSTLAGAQLPIDNEADVTWDAMFDAETYPAFASQIVRRPFQEAYDFVVRASDADGSFLPPDTRFTDFVTELNVTGADDSTFFDGSAGEVDAYAGALEAATFRVADRAELVRRFAAPAPAGRPELAVNGVVEVAAATGGTLSLAGMRVVKGGVLVLSGPGDIDVGDLEFGADLEFPLVLVARGGNIRLGRAGSADRPLPLAAVAPAGRVVAGGAPLFLGGGLFVDTLDVGELAAGGVVHHDPRLDPSRPEYRANQRVFVSDAPIR